MRIEHTINVDFQRPGVRPVVRIVEGDASTRYIVANLYNGGEPFSVGAGVTGVVKYAKSDGHSGVYDTIDKDKATEHAAVVFHDNSKQAVIELAPNISMGFGLVALIVQFVATSGTDILGTFPVDVIVERDPTDGTEAEDYFSYKALDELYAAIDKATEDAAAALAASEIDISTEYAEAKVSDPALTPERFMLNQPDGRYKISIGFDDDRVLIGRRLTVSGYFCLSVDDFYGGQEHAHSLYLDEYRVYTITASIQDDPVSINPKTLVGDLATAKSDISALQAENVALKNRVDAQGYELENLIVAGDGKIYSKSVDSSDAYTKIVPANALPYAALDNIGGKSVVLNQFVNANGATVTNLGITYVNAGDGTFVANGTASGLSFASVMGIGVYASVNAGNKIMVRGCPDGGSASSYRVRIVRSDSVVVSDFYGNEQILTIESDTKLQVLIIINNGITASDLMFAPEIINLTKMFGAGNEPQTVEQAYAMGVPQTYIPYNAGEIVSADVQSINASGKATKPIPQAIRNLPGYGWSAGSVYNEVDFAAKTYTQRVARVDLGTLSWVAYNTANGYFRAALVTLKTGTVDILTDRGYAAKRGISYSDLPDHCVMATVSTSPQSTSQIWLRDSALAGMTTAEVATALSGSYVYYELPEPIITDISNLLPANFEVLPVEDSGTVTFQQANGTTLPVPATITFPVKIGGDSV